MKRSDPVVRNSCPLTQWYFRRPFRRISPFFCAAVVLARSVFTFAEEVNPFGLPLPEDRATYGSVMLHGGGDGLAPDRKTATAIREKFLSLAMVRGNKARIVFIPSDQEQKEDDETQNAYETRLEGAYKWWYYIKDRRDKIESFEWLYPNKDGCQHDSKDCPHLDLLENATGVWMPAGDQEWLPQLYASNYPITTTRFQNALRKVIAKGGCVGGLGGAISSLAETVINGDVDSASGWRRARLGFGLALFNGAVVDQNFDSRRGRLERMTDLLRNGPRLNRFNETPGVERRTIGLGVERYTAMILNHNTVEVIGNHLGHVFLKGNGDRTVIWKTLANGQKLTIRTGSDRQPDAGPTLEENENPFGMPKPENKSKTWGQVVLHGGKLTDEIRDVYPQLAASHPDLIAHPGQLPRLMHCPAADKDDWLAAIKGARSPEIREAIHDWHLRNSYSVWADMAPDRFERVDFASPRSLDANGRARDEHFIKEVEKAHAIWFSGGDQKNLTALFGNARDPSAFQQAVINIVRQGGVVGGTSAGLAVMPTVMIAEGKAEPFEPESAKMAFGFGVLENVFAEQHFDARSGRIERLTAQLRNPAWPVPDYKHSCAPEQMIAIAVDEETALTICNNRVRVIGERTAHIFLLANDRNTVIWHALKSGDRAIIKKNDKGEHVLDVENWRLD